MLPRGACSCLIAIDYCSVRSVAGRPSKSGHQPIPLSTKIEIIKAVDSKQKFKSLIAKDFNVTRSTISSIIKNKEKTLLLL